MTATVIDGKAFAARVRGEVAAHVARLREEHGLQPGLAVVLVGEDPASKVYVRNKHASTVEVGMASFEHRLNAETSEAELLALIDQLNADPKVHGILVQLPLPAHLNSELVINRIDPAKDVDGFHPVNVGRLVIGLPSLVPCTPAGVRELLVRSGNDPAGRHVVVVGRSTIVGKPVANLLLQKAQGANAVVTVAHTGAADLSRYTRDADILVAAIGRPEAIRGEMVKPGCVVIDVGINRIPDPSTKSGTRLTGDVHSPSVAAVASAVTPVPGGVGPMTIAMLMKNTLTAAEGTPLV